MHAIKHAAMLAEGFSGSYSANCAASRDEVEEAVLSVTCICLSECSRE